MEQDDAESDSGDDVSELLMVCRCKGSEYPSTEPGVKGRLTQSFNLSFRKRIWRQVDVNTSSTYRELKAVFYVLKSYADRFRNQKFKVVDNMGASRILAIGSPKPHLQEIAVDIFSLCLAFGISLRADLLSRFIISLYFSL